MTTTANADAASRFLSMLAQPVRIVADNDWHEVRRGPMKIGSGAATIQELRSFSLGGHEALKEARTIGLAIIAKLKGRMTQMALYRAVSADTSVGWTTFGNIWVRMVAAGLLVLARLGARSAQFTLA